MQIARFGPEIYGPDGVLAQNLPGYEPRPAQEKMGEFVYRTLKESGEIIGHQECPECKVFPHAECFPK